MIILYYITSTALNNSSQHCWAQAFNSKEILTYYTTMLASCVGVGFESTFFLFAVFFVFYYLLP